jgi:hypothetical protein
MLFCNPQLPLQFLTERTLSEISDLLRNLQRRLNQESTSTEITTSLGITISTQDIIKSNDNQIEKFSDIISNLSKEGLISNLNLPTNVYTYNKAKMIVDSVKKSLPPAQLPYFIGLETLRSHPLKPGQVSYNYEYLSSHKYQLSPESASKSPEPEENFEYSTEVSKRIKEVQAAAEDFKLALDRCIQVEKILLTRVSQLVDL